MLRQGRRTLSPLALAEQAEQAQRLVAQAITAPVGLIVRFRRLFPQEGATERLPCKALEEPEGLAVVAALAMSEALAPQVKASAAVKVTAGLLSGAVVVEAHPHRERQARHLVMVGMASRHL